MHVTLIDFHWSGHHPTWFVHILRALTRCGHHVLAICPAPEEARTVYFELETDTAHSHQSTAVVNFVGLPSRRRRIFYPISDRMREIWMGNFIHHWIQKQAIKHSRAHGTEPGLLFFACIYDHDFDWKRIARSVLRIPWTGIYLHAWPYRMPGRPHPVTKKIPIPEKIFAKSQCQSIAILDEGIYPQVKDHLKIPIVSLPDPPAMILMQATENLHLRDSLRSFSNGRPTIGMFGHLVRSKGLGTILKAARLAAAKGLCFAICGEIQWPNDEESAHSLWRCLRGTPGIWYHPQRVRDEAELSGLMLECDVIAAAYHDFPHSSGILAKAAQIGKPVIVSDGYLMGERVKKYNLGAVIEQDNPKQLLEQAWNMIRINHAGSTRFFFGIQRYLEQHSWQNFDAQIRCMLDSANQ